MPKHLVNAAMGRLILPRRRFLKAAAGGLLFAPSIVRAGCLPLMGVGGACGGSAPAASSWGDHGTNIVLSTTTIANDTATNGNTNAYSSVRGTQAFSAGKHYFEVKILTAPTVANFIIGIMDNTTANGAPMDDRLLINSVGHQNFNGSVQANGWTGNPLGAGWSLSVGDYMGYALDQTNGFGYLSLNGVWFLTGDPTSGALGTGAVASGTFVGARPMLSLWGNTTAQSGIAQLITGSNINPAHIPSGYSAWA